MIKTNGVFRCNGVEFRRGKGLGLRLALAAILVSPLAHATSYNFATIDDPNSTVNTAAYGINDSGVVVGHYYGQSYGGHDFAYSGGTYTTVSVPGDLYEGAGGDEGVGINNNGQIVGTYEDSSGYTHGFLDTSGTFTQIDFPGVTGSTDVAGISNNGQITGSYYANGAKHGFTDTGGSFATIDMPGAADTFAMGSNIHGQIAGWYFDSNSVEHGFIDNNGVFTTLDAPGAVTGFDSGTMVTGINDLGQLVGTADLAGGQEAFVYSGGMFSFLTVPGGVYTTGYGINNNGQIVGSYWDGTDTSTDNGLHGFVATPVPDARMSLQIGVGLLLLGWLGRGRSRSRA
ncbi:MAG: DUF3466 family protein [Acidiferrobacteraceae bacterium]